MRPFRKIVLVLAATGLLAVLACSLHGPFSSLAARHWRRRLDEAPAGRADALASQMAQLGKPGIRTLVEALDAEREVAATAARRTLWAELERWESLTAPAVTRNLAILAEALSQKAEGFGPAARHDAADLAAEVLRWLPDSESPQRIEVIAHCDRVFDLVAADRQAAASLAAVAEAARAASAHSQPPEGFEPALARPRLETPAMPSIVAAVPGGGLPIDTLPSLGITLPPGGDAMADRQLGGPGPDPAPEVQGVASPHWAAPGAFLPDRVRPLFAGERLPAAPRPPTLPEAIEHSLAGPADAPARDEDFDPLDTDVLMRWLRSNDAAVAERAEVVLRRRGFTDVHIELARRLFDPDPEARMELARTVPRLTSVDPVPWLLWLSRDPHASVRLAAVSLMATTSDPAMHARIRQMAREDSDAGVQRVARRLDER